MAKRGIVLANGELGDPAPIKARLKDWAGALVIAADGGSRHAALLGLRPDVIVGDLDSLDPAWLNLPADFKDRLPAAWADDTPLMANVGGFEFVRVSPHKDETDLEVALQVANVRGVERIAIIGASGGRLDMTFANIHLLLNPMVVGLEVELWAGRQTARAILPPGATLSGRPGDTLSLIPLVPEATGITTAGLEYPLFDETLLACYPRGVSNVFTQQSARVDVREGALLAVHTPGRA